MAPKKTKREKAFSVKVTKPGPFRTTIPVDGGGRSDGGRPLPKMKKRPQQALATRVKKAALESGMSWAEWQEKRKGLVKALRVPGTTKQSKKSLKEATRLIRKSEGKKAAAKYAKKTTSRDKKGGLKYQVPNKKKGSTTRKRSSGGGY